MSDRSAELFMVLVPKLTEMVSKKMEVNIALVSKEKQRQFYDSEMNFILGYITALSDIVSQHTSEGQANGSIIQSVIVRSLQELFGDYQGEQFFNVVASHMSKDERPEAFEQGLDAGFEDANDWLSGNQRYGAGKAFVGYFSA